jgi:hypothetical protein
MRLEIVTLLFKKAFDTNARIASNRSATLIPLHMGASRPPGDSCESIRAKSLSLSETSCPGVIRGILGKFEALESMGAMAWADHKP